MLGFAYRSARRPRGAVEGDIRATFDLHHIAFWQQVAALARTDRARRELPIECRQILSRRG